VLDGTTLVDDVTVVVLVVVVVVHEASTEPLARMNTTDRARIP
jgi:hypothetical protein